jgi:hypothetical protein
MTPHAETTASTFSLSYSISHDIRAKPETIWALLTDARSFPSWNSTVTSIDGDIALGQRLAIEVPLAPGRTFKPKVTKLTANVEMEWSDGFAPMFRGVRTFKLTPKAGGVTEFSMQETFSGLMLPMIKGSLPNFAPAFESYATDLQRVAEAGR